MSMRDHNSLPNLARETLGTPCLDTRLTRQAHMCEQSAAMVSKLRSLEDTDTVDILACESNSQTHDSFGYPSNLQICWCYDCPRNDVHENKDMPQESQERLS